MKKLLTILLILIFLPVQAGFFDDLFSSSDDQDKDRGPFYFKISDSLKNGSEVSFENRKLKIKMFFYTRYYNGIDQEGESDLVNAFNSNLEVTTQKETDGPKDKLGQGLEFRFKKLPSQRSNDRYSLIVFESTNINITESQKLIFKFDQEQFAEDIGININENIYRKTFNYRPLTVEPKALNLEKIDGVVRITGDFKTAFDIDAQTEDLSFDLYRNGKKVKTLAKKFGRKFALTPSLVDESGDYLQKLSAGSYRINAPIELSLDNLGSLNKFIEGRKFSVKVPVLINTATNSGLEVKIKALVKAKLSDFLSAS